MWPWLCPWPGGAEPAAALSRPQGGLPPPARPATAPAGRLRSGGASAGGRAGPGAACVLRVLPPGSTPYRSAAAAPLCGRPIARPLHPVDTHSSNQVPRFSLHMELSSCRPHSRVSPWQPPLQLWSVNLAPLTQVAQVLLWSRLPCIWCVTHLT